MALQKVREERRKFGGMCFREMVVDETGVSVRLRRTLERG